MTREFLPLTLPLVQLPVPHAARVPDPETGRLAATYLARAQTLGPPARRATRLQQIAASISADDPLGLAAHYRLATSDLEPGSDAHRYARWWVAGVALPLRWSGHLNLDAAETLAVRWPDPRWEPDEWLTRYTDLRETVHARDGLSSCGGDTTPIRTQIRLLQSTVDHERGPGRRVPYTLLRRWLVSATPWMGAPTAYRTVWRSRAREYHAAVTDGPTPVPGDRNYTWAAHQRRRYGQGKLTPDQIAACEMLPGWRWSVMRHSRAAS